MPARAFLREVQIHAGMYAEAYFAVRARARVMVAGSVIPGGTGGASGAAVDGAAFTVAFDYGYAYIWGAGVSGYLDVELPDVPHVLGVVVEAVLDEALRLLPADTPPLVESMLRLVVPLAASAAVAVGKALGAPQSSMPATGSGSSSVLDPFLTELRTTGLNLVLTAATRAAVQGVIAALDAALDTITLGDDFVDKAADAVSDARQILAELEQAGSFAEGLPVVVRLLGRVLIATDTASGPEAAVMSVLTEGLTVAAVAGATLEQVLGRDPLPDLPAVVVARVRRKLGLGPTAPITVVHLVEYLGVEVGLLDSSFEGSVGWLADLVGTSVPAVIALLWSLDSDPPDTAVRRQLAAQALDGVVTAVTTHLQPFFDSLPNGELKDLTVFVRPLLEVLEAVLLPVITGPQDPDPQQSARVRDELDALLTGMFGAIVVRCMNGVIRPYFARGEAQLNELADIVDRRDPAFAEFFRLANEYDVVFRMSPAIVSATLREVAGVLDLAESSAFESAVELMTVFVLLPAENAERRRQLAVLAGTDDPRIGEAKLHEDLLDALFIKSTAFALGMVPPSIRMSTLIALDQGPVPLLTLFEDVKAIGEATVAAIDHAAGAVATVGGIIDGLIQRGTVTAEDLHRLGQELRTLISDISHLVDQVIDLVKAFSWPIFVTSSGGLGLLLRKQFDDFFDGAHWLVDQVHERLNQLTDALIEAAIAVAQDVGVLDTGEGDDLGSLGQAVRQRTLGVSGQPGLEMLDGAVRLSHAEVATMVVNSAFGNPQVREKVRTFHRRAVEQQHTAREAALLLEPELDDAKAAEAALRAALASQQRDTGFTFTITWVGLDHGASITSPQMLELSITGAGLEFVTAPHAQVRVEIGGWPVAIDPAAWWVDAQGTLRGRFTVICDPWLVAPHPFVGEGVVSIGPQAAALAAQSGLPGAELTAVRAVAEQQAINVSADPAAFLTQPLEPQTASVAATMSPSSFLPPLLRDGTAPLRRFPAILAVDRPAMMAGTQNAQVAAALAALPGTEDLGFVSASDLNAIMQPGGAPSSVRAPARLVAGGPSSGSPISVVARARPGYVPVTASVRAVPKAGQDQQNTPAGAAAPTWFILAEPVAQQPQPSHDDAEFVAQEHIPQAMRIGSTAPVMITMRNTGDTTWTSSEGYKLGAQAPAGNPTWGSAWQELPRPVAPSEEVTFAFTIRAPATAGTTFTWQMVRDRADTGTREWFGPLTPARQVGLSINNARFVAQSVPASVPRLGTASVSVTMRNTGTTTWEPGAAHRLGALGHDFGAARHELPGPVPPGQDVTFTFSIPAPGIPATFQWRMLQENVEWFGTASDPVQITPGEPLECADLRTTIAQLESDIAGLQDDLDAAAPGDKGSIGVKINARRAELKHAQDRSTALGCRP